MMMTSGTRGKTIVGTSLGDCKAMRKSRVRLAREWYRHGHSNGRLWVERFAPVQHAWGGIRLLHSGSAAAVNA